MPALVALLASGVLVGCTASDHDGGGAANAGQRAAAATTPVGTFAPVPNAPAAFDGVSGSATLTNASGGGSDVSITLRGLKPNVSYLSHVHAGTCD